MIIILLTYINRSGSTYLANLLSASDHICVCPEGDKLVSLFLESPDKIFRLDDHWKTRIEQILQDDSKLRHWGMGDDIFSALERIDTNLEAFLAFLHYYQLKQKPGSDYILFKAERLIDLFIGIENSRGKDVTFKYLSLIRDPRAVYASQKRTLVPGTDRPMSSNPVYTAMFWNHFIRAVAENQEHVDGHQILYHEFVQHAGETLFGLSGYLEMDFGDVSPGGGDLAERLPDGHEQIHPTISEIPSQEKIDQWKEELSQEEISLIQRKCKKHLVEFGFEVSPKSKNKLAITCKVIFFTLVYQIVQLKQIFRFHFKKIFS